MEKNSLHWVFFQALLSFYRRPKHRAKAKVQPVLCSFPPCGTTRVMELCLDPPLEVDVPSAQLLPLSGWCVFRENNSCCCYVPGDAQTSWCPSHVHREMDDGQYFGEPHLTSLLLPKHGMVGAEIAGEASAEINQLWQSLGEAKQECSKRIPPTAAQCLVPALATCPRCTQQLWQRCPLEIASWVQKCSQGRFSLFHSPCL